MGTGIHSLTFVKLNNIKSLVFAHSIWLLKGKYPEILDERLMATLPAEATQLTHPSSVAPLDSLGVSM